MFRVILSNELISLRWLLPYLQECENEMKTQTKTMEDGTVKEYYVPKEQEEDKLFDSGITQGINFAKYDKISVSLTKSVHQIAYLFFVSPVPIHFVQRDLTDLSFGQELGRILLDVTVISFFF